MKKIKLFIYIIISLFICSNNIEALEVKTGTIYRKNANNVTILFKSDTNGIYYYKVTDTSDVPDDIKTNGTLGGNVTSNSIVKSNITTLTTGKKYVHILVTDNTNEVIKTIELPYDLYYIEDFEIYDENAYPEFFYIKYEGPGNEYQKVISTTQLNNTNGNVFNLEGKNTWASDQRVLIDKVFSNGIIVLEADVKLNSYDPASIAIGNKSVNGWTGNLAAIFFDNSKFKYGIADNSNNETTSNKRYTQGNWLRAKIVLDSANSKFDYYINGEKINTEHIDTLSGYLVEFFAISACNNSIVYYDNIKLYNNTISSLIDHTITLDNDNNGTISTNKQIANSDDEITITQTPNTGYKLKNIKILKSSDKTDITNIVNYNENTLSFIMPDYDIDIIPSFEKIQYTITINTDNNIITPNNETITVLYGDNKDIEITLKNGYKLKSIKINNIDIENNNIIKLTNITNNYIIDIKSELKPYTINISPTKDNNTNNEYVNVIYNNNNIEITTNTGYQFESVKVNDIEKLDTNKNKVNLTNINENDSIIIEINKIENPKTSDSIYYNIILFIISFLILIYFSNNKNEAN